MNFGIHLIVSFIGLRTVIDTLMHSLKGSLPDTVLDLTGS